METVIPSASAIRSDLEGLGHAQMQELARVSGVPFTTLWKVRSGDTRNPGIETVRMFMPYLAAMKKGAALAAGA